MGLLVRQLLLESVVLPFGAAIALILAARALRLGPIGPIVAISIGFLLTYWALFGPPSWPLPSVRDKLPAVAFGAAACSLIADGWQPGVVLRRCLGMALLAAVVLWLAWSADQLPDAARLPPLVVALLLGWASLDGPDYRRRALSLLIVAASLALLAGLARTVSVAELCLAIASVVGALLVMAGGDSPSSGVLLIPTALLLALGCGLAWFSPTHPGALFLLLPVLFAAPLARLAAGLWPRPGPAWFALFGMLPALLAVTVAWLDA